jgi:7-cyano-7-deazaguanine synthase
MKTGVLLSGGMDSIALTYWKRPQIAITIDYGQAPAAAEIRAAAETCRSLSIEHHVIRIDCSELGSGDLAKRAPLEIAPVSEWWPYRNQLLVTLGVMRGLSLNLECLLVGSVQTDSVHADGTAEFYTKIDDLVSLQEGRIKVQVPAIKMTSRELVKISGVPQPILAWAHSCHVGNFACGFCRGCRKHFTTVEELGYVPY